MVDPGDTGRGCDGSPVAPSRPASDVRLIGRVLEGEEAAVVILFRRHATALFNFLRSRTFGAEHDAEELAQEVWLDAWRNLGRYDARRGDFYPWLCGIARRRLARHHRSRRVRAAIRENGPRFARAGRALAKALDEAESGDPGPTDRLESEEVGRMVAAVLSALSHDHREVLLLKYRESRSTREIASLLESTSTAINSRLQRARTAFRREVANVLGEDSFHDPSA